MFFIRSNIGCIACVLKHIMQWSSLPILLKIWTCLGLLLREFFFRTEIQIFLIARIENVVNYQPANRIDVVSSKLIQEIFTFGSHLFNKFKNKCLKMFQLLPMGHDKTSKKFVIKITQISWKSYRDPKIQPNFKIPLPLARYLLQSTTKNFNSIQLYNRLTIEKNQLI